MQARLDLDTRGFEQALTGLARMTARDLRTVIRAEAGSILKACAGDTKVATIKKTDQRSMRALIGPRGLDLSSARAPGDVTVNAGIRGPFGRVWVKSATPHRGTGRGFRLAGQLSRNGRFTPENYHWKNGTWTDITEAAQDVGAKIRQYLDTGRRAIGLARQSWVQIADAVGIRLESVPGGRISAAGIAKARAAIASTGRPYTNGTAREYGENREFVITLINRLPYGNKIALDRILARNVNARARYFEQNLARGVFDRISTIARAYPGLNVTRSS